MILIFPPVAKPCEPPAGVALLKSALNQAGHACTVVDASVEGLLYLIRSVDRAEDSWSARALKNRDQIIRDLKDPDLYRNMDRYHQRVYDLNHLLGMAVDRERFRLTLSNYMDRHLLAVSSSDLLKSARTFEDNPFLPYFEQRLAPLIESEGCRHIGISLCYLNQALVSFALAGWVRHRFPDRKLIMGGGLVSSWMSQPGFGRPFSGLIDHMIAGEGEQALLSLLGHDPGSRRHFIPDYDFVNPDLYLSPGLILPFRASIGCYWSKCRFCPEKAETRAYSSQRSARVLADLDQLSRTYRPDHIHLIDNAVTPAFLKALADRDNPFSWYGFVRFEKELADPAFCRRLKQSGCRMLKLGLESGDPDVLDRMNKGTDLDTVSDILKSLDHAGILSFVYLLFGTSFEDEAAAFRTLEYVKAHQQFIHYLNLAVFNLPRFSDDARGLETMPFYQGDLSLYLDFVHPRGWRRRQVKQFLDKHFKPALAKGHIRKNPAFFSSNHAAFFPFERTPS